MRRSATDIGNSYCVRMAAAATCSIITGIFVGRRTSDACPASAAVSGAVNGMCMRAGGVAGGCMRVAGHFPNSQAVRLNKYTAMYGGRLLCGVLLPTSDVSPLQLLLASKVIALS